MSRLPPGPKWFKPIHFFQSGINPPTQVLSRLAARYGDPFRISYITGPVTFTGKPEALQAIYSANPSQFSVWGRDIIEPVFGRNSVVVTEGDQHRRDRKLLAPVFSGNPMRALGETIVRATEAKTSAWIPGRPFRMIETAQSITLDIMVRIVFGIQAEDRIKQACDAVVELIDSLNVVIFLYPSLRQKWGGLGPWSRYLRAVQVLNQKLSEEIQSRKGKQQAGNDILGLMMNARYDDGQAMQETEIMDHMRGLLFAGHEATSIVISWICYWINRHPLVKEKMLAELDALGPDPDPHDFTNLPYLEAVCKETLRLCPPVVDPSRIALAPFEMSGYTIPAREAIRPSINLLHARPEIYPEPERFRPERFLERKYTPFEFIPFGGGARRCLGAAFAMYEIKIVMGVILRKYRIRLAHDREIKPVRCGLVVGPAEGVPMVLEGKREA